MTDKVQHGGLPHDDERVVLDFFAATSRRDLDAILAPFRANAVYHNIPVAPIVGIDGIRGILRSFLAAFTEIDIQVLSIASRDGVVLTERIDRFTMASGTIAHLPVAGTFYFEKGQIKLWRDYFDLATFQRETGIRLG